MADQTTEISFFVLYASSGCYSRYLTTTASPHGPGISWFDNKPCEISADHAKPHIMKNSEKKLRNRAGKPCLILLLANTCLCQTTIVLLDAALLTCEKLNNCEENKNELSSYFEGHRSGFFEKGIRSLCRRWQRVICIQ